MKFIFRLGYYLVFIFLTSCASRGWQLSEQIHGVDNKLKPVKKTAFEHQANKRGLASVKKSKDFYSKDNLKFKGEMTPTSFNEPGLILISE